MKIGYCRTSIHGQRESLATQEEQLRAQGCEKIFSDAASSAKAPRPGLTDLLSFARKGDVIIVTRLDRLGHSITDTLSNIQLLDKQGVSITSLDTGLDTSAPDGRLALSVLTSLVQWERDLLIERTKEGLAHARAQGRTGGRSPKLEPSQQEAALAALSEGMSENQVAAAFGVSRSTISRLKKRIKQSRD